MRPTDRSHSIAFLLSLGAIPVACTGGEDGPSTGLTAVATSIGSGSMTDPADDTSDSLGTDGDGTTTGGTDPSGTSPSTTATTTTTMSPTDPSLTDPSSMTDPDTGYGTYGTYGTYGSGGFQCSYQVPPACSGYAAKLVECYPRYVASEDMIGTDCGCRIEYYAAAYGPGCAGAVEDYYACIASTSCQVLAGGNACAGPSMNVIEACGFDEPGG